MRFNVKGADRLWAFNDSLEIPLQHIAAMRADPSIARSGWRGFWWHGVRLPGTRIPGVITAGTFYQDRRKVFNYAGCARPIKH